MTIKLDRDLCFVDCETLGLHPDAPVWEVAAVRLDHTTGQPSTAWPSLTLLIQHDRYRPAVAPDSGDWLDDLPEKFRADYIDRYRAEFAIRRNQASEIIAAVTDGAIIAGSNPRFDMERLGKLLHANGITPTWHYHPLDIPSMVLGYVAAVCEDNAGDHEGQFRSEQLSRHVGVDPAQFERHTAYGDVNWCIAQWRNMTGGAA